MKEDIGVVLASNRGPVSFVETESGEFTLKRGAGGLAGALDPVARRLGDRAVWLAAATSDTDRRALSSGAGEALFAELGYPHYLLDIEPELYAEYYDVASNRMLWFANHCLWDELDIHEFGEREIGAWEEAYEPVNRRFAEAIREVSDPDDLVLFQDYHLASAPRYLRDARPDQFSLHFTHSSFCCEGLERLPGGFAEHVIRGMLACDLVGFHTHAWAGSFLDCCAKIGAAVDRAASTVDLDGHRSWVRAYPIQIDAGAMTERASRGAARSWAERFTADSLRLIVRADRTEPSKNIIRGFEAFGALLDRRSDLRSSVRFIACLYPSRLTMPEYQRYMERVEDSVKAVNDRHPGSIELFMKDDFDRTLGALLTYDVLLVNSIMDGMNLVSKEGPTINENSGVLVLSRGAGSFEELGEVSLTIEDPYDIDETTNALEAALDLDDTTRKEMAEELRHRASVRLPEDWIEAQIADLEAIKEHGAPISN